MSGITTLLVQIAMFSVGCHLLEVRLNDWRKIVGYLLVAFASAVSVSL